MGILEQLLAPETLALLIPLSAVGGGFYLASLRIKAKMHKGLDEKEKQAISMMMKENSEIKQRVENLESIITSMDKEILALKEVDETLLNQQKVKSLSDKMKS